MSTDTIPIPDGLEEAVTDMVMVAGAAALCADPDEGREHLLENVNRFADQADDYWWFMLLRSTCHLAVEIAPNGTFGPGGGPAALVAENPDGSPVENIDREMSTNVARGQLAAMRLVTAAVNGDTDTWVAIWESLAPAAEDDTRFPAAVMTVLEWVGEIVARHAMDAGKLPEETQAARRERERRAS